MDKKNTGEEILSCKSIKFSIIKQSKIINLNQEV